MLKKCDGFADVYIIGLCFLVILLTLLIGTLTMNIAVSSTEKLKTKVDFSNLATYKSISQTALSNDGSIVFGDIDTTYAFNTFKLYLETNLKLDFNLCPIDTSGILKTPLVIQTFILYSVDNSNLITEYIKGLYNKRCF